MTKIQSRGRQFTLPYNIMTYQTFGTARDYSGSAIEGRRYELTAFTGWAHASMFATVYRG